MIGISPVASIWWSVIPYVVTGIVEDRAVGCRAETNGALYLVGNYGYYWSSGLRFSRQ